MTRNSALLALAFAGVLAIADFAIFIASGQPWPFWMAGFITAGVLCWGGVRTLSQGSSRLLSAAWGVAVGIFWMSFFSHTDALNTGAETPYAGGMLGDTLLTMALGAMLLTSIAGLCLSLSRRSI